jgi:hypothetical protein
MPGHKPPYSQPQPRAFVEQSCYPEIYIEANERKAFEKWIMLDGSERSLARRSHDPDAYESLVIQAMWRAWKARATLRGNQ